MRIWLALALALAATALPSLARADVTWRVAELRREQCMSGALYEPEVAIEGCTHLIRARFASSGDRAEAFKRRGDHYRRLGQYADALADYTQAISNRADYTAALYRRSQVFLELGDYAQADRDAARVVELAPETPGGHRVRCQAAAMGALDLDAGHVSCNAALALEPDEPETLAARGLIALRRNDHDSAWRDFDDALRGAGDNAHYRYGRGVAALRLGQDAQGRADLAAAMHHDENVAATFAGYGITP